MRFRDRLHRLAVFYQAQDSTIKALGRSAKLRFVLGINAESDDSNTVRCRQLPLYPDHRLISEMRGKIDARAMRNRFGVRGDWGSAYPHLSHQSLHEEMEQLRCESLGARELTGVRHNLSYLSVDPAPANDVAEVLSVTRYKLDLSDSCPTPTSISPQLEHEIDKLIALCDSPCAFHRQIERIARQLDANIDALPNLDLVNGDESEVDDESASLHWTDELGLENGEEATESSAFKATNPESYRVYNAELDQIVQAEALADEARLTDLRETLDQTLRASRISLSYLASRLLHALSSYQLADWENDHDEGLLDLERLDQLITDPLYARGYRQQRKQHVRDVAVSLLIDNSGSMRGHPITVAALCSDMLSRTLERCGIVNEVLGFTTRFWRGGAIRDQWLAERTSRTPGRLNALRHIIYKSGDRSWRKSRLALAQMLDQDLLKENIDGEALKWACTRLSHRPESRKILVVISDGAPRDESTNQANGDQYLAEHLNQVIGDIERKTEIELLAIGIGHDVSRYYRNAIEIPDVVSLGEVLVDQLVDLLTEGSQSQQTGRRPDSIWAGATRNRVSL